MTARYDCIYERWVGRRDNHIKVCTIRLIYVIAIEPAVNKNNDQRSWLIKPYRYVRKNKSRGLNFFLEITFGHYVQRVMVIDEKSVKNI